MLWGLVFALQEVWDEGFERWLLFTWMILMVITGIYAGVQCFFGMDFLWIGGCEPFYFSPTHARCLTSLSRARISVDAAAFRAGFCGVGDQHDRIRLERFRVRGGDHTSRIACIFILAKARRYRSVNGTFVRID